MEPAAPSARAAGARRERLPVRIFDEPDALARAVARRVAALVEERRAAGETAVLGLPTGSTPVGVYRELVRMHREEGLDLTNVVTFNLDEYVPMPPESLQSYHRFMRENFFDLVDIPAPQVHVPRGDLPREAMAAQARDYEQAITEAGGLDLVLLGIGRSGHVGFNEPGSDPASRTRLVALDEITRKDAASDFFGEEHVPREAITMGLGTILDAREVLLLATGEHKAPIVRQAVEDAPSPDVTASFLQRHRNATVYLDRAAASALTREATPWLVRAVEWTPELAKRAVIWLAETTGKPLLHLEPADFHRHHLHDLAAAYESVDHLALGVFEDLRSRIRYRAQLPQRERVVVFSPHPDDDVISMGGTLDALARNANDLVVAYMTNGSVAVFDADVRRHLRFVELSLGALGLDGEGAGAAREAVAAHRRALDEKGPGEIDTEGVQLLKAHIRYAEAVAAIEVMGLGEPNARFLDLPFYQTGRVRKNPITEADVQIVLDLLEATRPHHVYVAGDLSDPHGTHRMCYAAVRAALDRYTATGGGGDEADRPRPTVWLYRGAWQEWEVHRADVFVPLSKTNLARKIEAIFKHESQKDRAMFPGAYDEREFWERARDRSRGTAEALARLGLPTFYAAEAFVTTDRLGRGASPASASRTGTRASRNGRSHASRSKARAFRRSSAATRRRSPARRARRIRSRRRGP
jgi:glucosamine-6-phosphate deaminase